MSLKPALDKVRVRENLSVSESEAAFDVIFRGSTPDEDVANFLIGLRDKGETADELLGAVTSMRDKAIDIIAPINTIDIVGTGGDGRNTPNISTAAALVVAGCGVPVAKHGNRASTSKSGSSDVLAALGINLEPPLPVLEDCLHEAHLCFLFAPRHHPAMAHVANIRKKIGTRTIFNLLGPLTNPAKVKKHLIGVYDEAWLKPMAEVLLALGSQSAWLTHGQDGMDELTTQADSMIVSLRNNRINEFTLRQTETGLAKPETGALDGGDAVQNAAALTALLAGAKSAYRDIVILNAAAALIVAGKVPDLTKGLSLAADSIDSGAALVSLTRLIELTNKAA